MRWLLVPGVCLGSACGSSLPLTEATDAGARDASVDAGSVDATPIDASADAALPPLGCLTLPIRQLPALKPSLPVTPKLLWRKQLMPNWGVTGFLVRSGNQLAFSARQLHVFDLSGTHLWSTDYPSFDVSVGSISADTEGNYYQFADKLYSYTSAGVKRYSVDLGDTSQGGDTFSPAPIVRGADDLFFHSVDGFVRRLDARTGARRWERPAIPGRTGLLAANGRLSEARGRAWSADTGEEFSVYVDSAPARILAVANGGAWASVGVQSARMVAVDGCLRVTRPVSPNDLLVATIIDSTNRFWETFLANGVPAYRALAPTPPDGQTVVGDDWPSFIGADGTTYAFVTSAVGAVKSTIITLRSPNEATQTLSVPGVLSNPTLGEDGVMHAVSSEDDGIYLIALQTRSPGVGETPLPMPRSDNRRSGWPRDY